MCIRDPRSGVLLREDDREPLRTKIVATIGTPELYHQREAVDLDGKPLQEVDYDFLVSRFYENGVDILRLNCSFVEVGEIAQLYPRIKRAVLKAERAPGNCKPMAVLADLPGPKIRFQIKTPIPVNVGQPFKVHFLEEVHDPNNQTVYIDRVPFKQAMDGEDEKWIKKSACAAAIDPLLAEAVIGCHSGAGGGGRFQNLLEKIREQLLANKDVLVFVGDGEVVLRVTVVDEERALLDCVIVSTKVTELAGNKGFTLKGFDIDVPTFTETDQKLLEELLRAEYEPSEDGRGESEPVLAFLALSFAQTGDDVLRLREFVERWLQGRNCPETKQPFDVQTARLKAPAVVAKIETKRGWCNIDFILDVADAAMVARGDLGLQMKVEEVPQIQKQLIELCQKRGKPVITATEMLKSMTMSMEPTRAEGSDVFNAIEDGTDAVMMSEESANGRYPFHTVRKMVAIVERAELHMEMHGADEARRRMIRRQRLVDFLNDDLVRIKKNEVRLAEAGAAIATQWAVVQGSPYADPEELESLSWRHTLYQQKLEKALKQETTNRITQATCTLTEASGAKCILTPSASGRTARMISRLRPALTIIGAAHDLLNMRKMCISHGVFPICMSEVECGQSTDEMFDHFERVRRQHRFLRTLLSARDKVIFTAGTPLRTPGTTNLVQIKEVKGP